MKITVLMDNHTDIDVYYLGEPAVSYWIETEGRYFLLDCGYSDAFLKNAQAMDIPIEKTEAVIISHSHIDHTGGLPCLMKALVGKKPKLICHPLTLLPRQLDGIDIGCPLSRDAIAEGFDLREQAEPLWLTKKLVFLGQIPRETGFEKPYSIGNFPNGEPDMLLDDTALAYVADEGIYVVTACSHSGICNILSYAKKITGKNKILGVIGGFHLLTTDERSRKTINFLAAENIPCLYPCHCTSFQVRAALNNKTAVGEVGVGLTLGWE